jgi:repressor LexA
MNTGITGRQQDVLTFLTSFQVSHGYPPSTREIQRHFGFKSQNAAMNHLRALARKNLIAQLGGRVWATKADEEKAATVSLPILGAIKAGQPTPGEQISDEWVTLDLFGLGFRNITPSRMFGLHVSGDSMMNAHILDGDLALLEKKPHREGDIVAALIDGETTLKRLVVEKRHVYLKAENPNYREIFPVEQLEIQGVLVGLVRMGQN